MKKSIVVKIREFVRLIFLAYRYFILKQIFGMDISKSARISFRAIIDKTNPKGIHIGDESYVASGAVILSHDFATKKRHDTEIGRKCFVGVNAIILPGVTIGDSVIVGAGAVVVNNIPSGCIVAGNPAKIIREHVQTTKFGQIISNDPI
jgi:acetyltransferase-like isoleucine patch superfamily enzyme